MGYFQCLILLLLMMHAQFKKRMLLLMFIVDTSSAVFEGTNTAAFLNWLIISIISSLEKVEG